MKKFALLLTLASAFSLAGCNNSILNDDDKNMTPQQLTCKRLYRQMVYNRHNNNVQAKWLARSQNARLKQLYKENECDKYR